MCYVISAIYLYLNGLFCYITVNAQQTVPNRLKWKKVQILRFHSESDCCGLIITFMCQRSSHLQMQESRLKWNLRWIDNNIYISYWRTFMLKKVQEYEEDMFLKKKISWKISKIYKMSVCITCVKRTCSWIVLLFLDNQPGYSTISE